MRSEQNPRLHSGRADFDLPRGEFRRVRRPELGRAWSWKPTRIGATWCSAAARSWSASRPRRRNNYSSQLEVGQTREGVVRNIRDFGAFVDLGGIDGMVHVSQMSWDRVKHPSEVLHVGQKVKVKIQKIDPETHKISLAYRDLFESPWTNATSKYPVTSKVTGTVSKLMDFGAVREA